MVQISSSILSADFAALAQDCRKVISADNPMLHIDVMDGVFVPNISIGLPVLQCLKRALPQAVYDVHLMIVSPDRYVGAFAGAGADFITVHCEVCGDTAKTLRDIRAAGCKAGLSLRPATAIETVFPLLCECDMVLVMSVEPGFGGQAFMPQAPARLAALRAEADRQGLHKLLLEVDGGVNAKTAPLCAAAKADILVAGSAVFGAPDPAAAVLALRGKR